MQPPSPARVVGAVTRPLGRLATSAVRRVLGITPEPLGELTKVPDDLPRDQMFQQPLTCSVEAGDPEEVDEGTRVTFRVLVRDATGRRCPDLAVEATVTGPERTRTGQVTTDMFGAARFRMTGPAGTYRCDVEDVAAFALDWDRDASQLRATTEV